MSEASYTAASRAAGVLRSSAGLRSGPETGLDRSKPRENATGGAAAHSLCRLLVYVDQRSGEVKTIAYRMPPETKKRGKDEAMPDEAPAKPARPEVTQKGVAMIGDLRTDALHQALDSMDIPNETLIGLLVLALGARNVSVHTTSLDYGNREAICERISEGGVLSADHALLHAPVRHMLKRLRPSSASGPALRRRVSSPEPRTPS